MQRAARLAIVLVVVLCAAAAGFHVASALAPDQLHERVEGWLSEATRSEARISSLRLVLGLPIRLEGTGLRLYDGALSIESASARIDVVSLLIGRPRLTRLRLDGAQLEVQRTPEGTWSPPIFGSPADREPGEPALAPLRVIEGATRALLTRPLLADTLIVRRSRIRLVHPRPGGGDPVHLDFQSVNGRLLHSRLFGDARLFLRVRLEERGLPRGRLEWQGTRDEDGAMRATMAATGLDLSTLAPYVRGARPAARLEGMLDGIADFETTESGVGRLDLDLSAHELVASLADGAAAAEPLRLPRLVLRMGVDLGHDRVEISGARIGTEALDFTLEAGIGRPLRDASPARVRVALGELVLAPEIAEKLAGWLPGSARDAMVPVAQGVGSGRLLHAELRGTASVERWGDLATGALEQLPAGLHFDMAFEDVAIRVGDANRLSALRGAVSFEGDTLEIAEASGQLNDGPLPDLSVRFENVSTLLAAPRQAQSMHSSAEALVGLTPLFEFLSRDRDPDADAPGERPSVELFLEHVHHPALLWPIQDVRVQLVPERDADGVLLQVERAAWAGARVDGSVDWTLRPERRLDIALVASAPDSDAAREPAFAKPDPSPGPGPPDASVTGNERWIEGRFTVGPVSGERWSQAGARGRFSAAGGGLRIEQVEIDLVPSGRLSGEVDLDLTDAERVPYAGEVRLERADLATLIRQRGAESELATGSLDAEAALRGSLVPGRSLLHDATGEAALAAWDGTIQRSVPPVLALALASTSLNPFSRREALAYQRASAEFAIREGLLTTEGLDIEGPDVRMFVSGSLDFGEDPHEIDAEVALFLFRQMDRALDLIPVVNVLLLGENQNLLAAYFQLSGSWNEPTARPKPIRSLAEGPAAVLTKNLPNVMMRGMRAIGGLFRGSEDNGSRPEADPAASVPPDATAEPAP